MSRDTFMETCPEFAPHTQQQTTVMWVPLTMEKHIAVSI